MNQQEMLDYTDNKILEQFDLINKSAKNLQMLASHLYELGVIRNDYNVKQKASDLLDKSIEIIKLF